MVRHFEILKLGPISFLHHLFIDLHSVYEMLNPYLQFGKKYFLVQHLNNAIILTE